MCTDADSPEQAFLRVPRILRTRDRALTAEDFENLTQSIIQQIKEHLTWLD